MDRSGRERGAPRFEMPRLTECRKYRACATPARKIDAMGEWRMDVPAHEARGDSTWKLKQLITP